MGHQGSVERKVKAIEYLDSRVIKPVKEGLEAAGEDFRMLVLPDHPTQSACGHIHPTVCHICYMTAQIFSSMTGSTMKLRASRVETTWRVAMNHRLLIWEEDMLIVKKFGGSSVADKERIFNVAKRCIEDYEAGNDVVVVLSAMGNIRMN